VIRSVQGCRDTADDQPGYMRRNPTPFAEGHGHGRVFLPRLPVPPTSLAVVDPGGTQSDERRPEGDRDGAGEVGVARTGDGQRDPVARSATAAWSRPKRSPSPSAGIPPSQRSCACTSPSSSQPGPASLGATGGPTFQALTLIYRGVEGSDGGSGTDDSTPVAEPDQLAYADGDPVIALGPGQAQQWLENCPAGDSCEFDEVCFHRGPDEDLFVDCPPG
jgi:hypothetical protein